MKYSSHADLGLDFCSESTDGVQEGFVLWFKGGTSLHIFEGHVQFSKLLQSLAATIQGFNVCCININRYVKIKQRVIMSFGQFAYGSLVGITF